MNERAPILGAADMEIPGRDGVPEPMCTLLRIEDARWFFCTVASPDGLCAYIKLTPGEAFAGVAADEIVGNLNSCGVIHGHIVSGIAFFAAMQSGPGPYDCYFQVARGDPMSRGENGSIEFHVQPSSSHPRYDLNVSGNIDYKQLNLIENCFAGQRVASILPPGPGRAGKDIFGRDIPPEPGVPVDVKLGNGVRASQNGREISAEIDGRVIHEDGKISVSTLLEINHDVDLSIGNLDFVGRIVVNGSLPDGFYINGRQGVEIRGDMGAARIASEGDVKLTGGVKGKRAGVIFCRNLNVRYLDETIVEASGDVVVEKEIVHSNVKALGRVSVPHGTILGGTICGFRGVEADTIGSELGVATRVMAGLDWTDENRMEEIRIRLAERMERVHSAQVLLEPLFADPKIKSTLDNEQQSILYELVAELRDLRGELHDILRERTDVLAHAHADAVRQINVGKLLHLGVETSFTNTFRTITDSVKGPLSIIDEVDRSTPSIVEQRHMPTAAEFRRKLEKAIAEVNMAES
ncbi:MAG: FapA family protein [Planctomycetota bacterium]|jgi:uncharacterized protein (DUF342 family)|nr:FapA family protein [Planctomycetota bacterium]